MQSEFTFSVTSLLNVWAVDEFDARRKLSDSILSDDVHYGEALVHIPDDELFDAPLVNIYDRETDSYISPPARVIELELGGIKVTLDGEGGGSVSSDLHSESITEEEDVAYESMIDALESFILALACAGVNIKSKSFTTALTTTIDAVANNA